ncbi:UvrABC system protein [Trichinella spiralis]|uniref:UvrABC system protein n=1 Tax=Trichinella spiralis TaxID=6334 RepID=A0ABR3KYD0_TRISP
MGYIHDSVAHQLIFYHASLYREQAPHQLLHNVCLTGKHSFTWNLIYLCFLHNCAKRCADAFRSIPVGFHNCQITDCNLGSVPIFVTDVRISADKFTTLKNMSQRKRSNQLFNIICNKKGILLISHGSESIISKFRAIFPYFGLRCP